MKYIKKLVRKSVRRLGYEIVQIDRDRIAHDPIEDMQRFMAGYNNPLMFDVGANAGQSIIKFRERFPDCVVHSFEPGSKMFLELKVRFGHQPNTYLWNLGLGSQNASMTLIENQFCDLSSFLELGPSGWGDIVARTNVDVVTTDSFCQQRGIDFVHVLKSDTQGYDYEVLKGASQMLSAGKIGLIYLECNYADMYLGQAPFDEIYKFLREKKYRLVTFYRSCFRKELCAWNDALFIHEAFYLSRIERRNKVSGN